MAAIHLPAKISAKSLRNNYGTVVRFEFPSKAVVSENEGFILRNGNESFVRTELQPKQPIIAQSKLFAKELIIIVSTLKNAYFSQNSPRTRKQMWTVNLQSLRRLSFEL